MINLLPPAERSATPPRRLICYTGIWPRRELGLLQPRTAPRLLDESLVNDALLAARLQLKLEPSLA